MSIDWIKLTPLDAEIKEALAAVRRAEKWNPEIANKIGGTGDAIRALQRAGALVAAIHGEADVITMAVDNAQTISRDAHAEIKRSAENIIGYAGIREQENQS